MLGKLCMQLAWAHDESLFVFSSVIKKKIEQQDLKHHQRALVSSFSSKFSVFHFLSEQPIKKTTTNSCHR